MSYLAQVQLGGLGTVLRMEQNRTGKFYELLDFWDHALRDQASLSVEGQTHTIEYALAPSSFLEYLCPGERFGCFIYGMMLINVDLVRDKPQWVPYVLMKLYAETLVDQGVDESGKAKHYQALFGTIRLAGMTMSRRELEEFLRPLMEHDRDGYFDLDHEVRRFMEAGGPVGEAKRRYLERHHNNRWVRRGRLEESLPQGLRDEGFRNHAEALYRNLSGFRTQDAYMAAMCVHELMHLEPDNPTIIDPFCSGIAYALTKEANGLVDLVRFLNVPSGEVGHNVIVRLSGKYTTWSALAKRLSFGIHRAEQEARLLLEEKRHEIAGLLAQADSATQRFNERVVAIRTSAPPPGMFEDTLHVLQRLSGDWSRELSALAALSATVSQAAKELDEAADVLLLAI